MPGLEISFQNLKIQAMKTPVSKQAISSPRRISARTVFPQKSALESFKSQPRRRSVEREGGGVQSFGEIRYALYRKDLRSLIIG